jgi:hypothetical protein
MTTNPYWTEDGKAKNLALLTSTERYKMLETLRTTEAQEWLRRYAIIKKMSGQPNARHWWESVKADIERKRGKDGLNTLIAEMNRQRNDANPLSS